jgi:hypothetical protein
LRQTCPYCGSTKTTKRGQHPRQRYQCTDGKHPSGVSRYFYGEDFTSARVLVLDIETLPGRKRFWNLGDQDWGIDSIIDDWIILGWAAKWLFNPSHMTQILTPKEAKARDDSRLVSALWKMLDKADIVIAHNGDRFDLPKINYRLLIHDMLPPSPYQTVDTRTTAAKVFGATSNKLDWLAQKLGVGHKLHTDYSLWVRCEAGEAEALRYMQDYNVLDTYVLEDVYVKLRPWIKHPNMAMFSVADPKELVCGRCGSDDLDPIGVYPPKDGYASVYETHRCNHCGGLVRVSKAKRTYTSRVV